MAGASGEKKQKTQHCSQLSWDHWYYYPVCETFISCGPWKI